MPNRSIIVMVVGITLLGLYRAFTTKDITITRVLIGAWILALILAVADMFPGLDRITSGIALVAFLTAILAMTDILGTLGKVLGNNPNAANAAAAGGSARTVK